MLTLRGEERIGAEELEATYLNALVGEIRIAQGLEKSINFIGAEKKVLEAIGKMRLPEHSEINRCILNALSFIITSSQKAMETLEVKKLL